MRNMLKILETKRLRLRPMRSSDADTIVRWRNSPHVASMSLCAPDVAISVEDHLAWFSSTRNDRLDYVIEVKSESRPVGSVSYVWRNLQPYGLCGESGRYIGEMEALRQGYAFEAAVCWFDFGFTELGLEAIVARTRKSNTGNLAINNKLGASTLESIDGFAAPSDEWVLNIITRRKWQETMGENEANATF